MKMLERKMYWTEMMTGAWLLIMLKMGKIGIFQVKVLSATMV